MKPTILFAIQTSVPDDSTPNSYIKGYRRLIPVTYKRKK